MRAKRWAAALLCPALLLFCAEYPAAAETAAPPAISSLSAVVYEPESGTVLYEKDGRTARPMASTTKLMTALLASELLGAEDTVRVPAAALPVEGSQVGLAAGDEATVRDLLAARGEDVAKCVASGEADRGIVICGTGVGISLAANKVHGIRCACVSEPVSARMCRAHNNCNMIAFGARIVGPQMAEAIVDAFLETEAEGGRHAQRVAMIMDIERRESGK